MHRSLLAAAAVLPALAAAAPPAAARASAATAPRVSVTLVGAPGADVVRPSISATSLRHGASYRVQLAVSGTAPASCTARLSRTVRASSAGTLRTVVASG